MKNGKVPATGLSEATTTSTGEEVNSHDKNCRQPALVHEAQLSSWSRNCGSWNFGEQNFAVAQGAGGKLTKGDVAILQFLAAAVIIESVQDVEVATLASKLIPGYPAKATGRNPLYMQDLLPLDRLRAELLRNMGCGGLLNQSVNQPH
jgi:hypothetical protein